MQFMTARVLLVEDDARLASMVCDYLGEAGYRVGVAPTGADDRPSPRIATIAAACTTIDQAPGRGIEPRPRAARAKRSLSTG